MIQLKDKRVFVSGAAGVIGRELIPMLTAAGAKVWAGDLKPCPEHFKGVLYRQGDLNSLTPAEVEAFAPEIFIHLAATFERSTETYGFWAENFRHNVLLSHHLMDLLKDAPFLHRVVFASSYLIYDPELYQFSAPAPQARRLNENDPVSPRNLTGMAKFSHEMELRFLEIFCHSRFSSVMTRIYRGYGLNSRDVISRWVRSLLQGEEIQVFRKEGMFDYVFSRDTAEGLMRLAAAQDVTGIVNLGTGRSRRVSEVVDILRSHFPGMKARDVESDIPYEASEADTTLLQSRLGWVPSRSLEVTIPEIIAFEKSRADQKTYVPGNAVVTSASRKVPMLEAVKQAAAKLHPDARVFAADSDPDCLARHFADGFWHMPATDDANFPLMLEWLKANGIRFVFPSRDGELSFWSRHARTLASNGISVMVSPPETVADSLDKLRFPASCLPLGIPAIPASAELNAVTGERLVVKERYGAGSRSMGLNLSREAATEHAKRLADPLYQPFISGEEISVDGYVDRNGNCKGIVLRKRDRVVNGESQITTTFRSEVLESQFAEAFVKIGIRGHAIMQAILGEAGAVHIIECNARFGGASTLSLAAGLDSFFWFMQEASGNSLDAFPFSPSRVNLRQVRHPHDIILHDPRI